MTKQKESSVILFGKETDPDVQRSIDKIKKTGRKVNLTPRPSFDTGIGQCGNHLCSCIAACIQTGHKI